MTNNLPRSLYRCVQVRELDSTAIDEHGIAGIVLMKRAGREAFACLREHWPDVGHIVVLCGSGNNAGDGYVLAALAAQKQVRVSVRFLSPPDKLKNEALAAYQYARQELVEILPFDESENIEAGAVIVDALLGIGISGAPRADYESAIKWVNRSGCAVLALDIPSGLCGDTGRCETEAIRADVTMTFVGCKQGLLTGQAPAYVGKLLFSNLGLPEELYMGQAASAENISLVSEHLPPPREQDAHKGLFGHVMVIGGDVGFGGAALMAAESALAAGAGSVSLATQPEHVSAALSRRPELMVMGIKSGQNLEPQLHRATVLAVGPGLGQSSWSEQFLQKSLDTEVPIVIDADGLNVLAGRLNTRKSRGKWVLTPHPGEAARLLGCTVAKVQADRFGAVRKIQEQYGGVVVLKGAGTLIADADKCFVARVGNPAMATAGSGDILCGLIAALIAQGLSLVDAAKLGVCIHGHAGDRAAQNYRSIFASQMIPYIREAIV